MNEERGLLQVGGLIDPRSGERTGAPLGIPARDLTTHGVITAMTGSGKTGLAVVLLEEALLSGVPVLVLDPKGDMGNLLLQFPQLRPEDFAPWVDPAEAEREGIDAAELARRTAERWSAGLQSWGLGSDRIAALSRSAEFNLFTPGSSAGAGLSLIGDLAAPGLDWESHAEVLQDEIEGIVSSLLTIADRPGDPISDPAHILLANLIEHEWRAGRGLDLARLIGLVQDPPFRKLGVFPLDTFFPQAKRSELAMRLNGLVASSSFAGWLRGRPLDFGSLIRSSDGRPTASIVHLAHLSDAERQFVVTLVLTRLITWMRAQPGTSDLRLLVYVDEMFGFAPPTAEPPSKKPFLTLFKQARAHGVGLVVATQNPVDLDYKTMSNAGTWIVGRLQTERDKLRVLEGLASASGGVDVADYDRIIGGLRKREFVLKSAGSSEPQVFTSRWAMSYLRGPLTRQEIAKITPKSAEPTSVDGRLRPQPEIAAEKARPDGADDESPVAPAVPSSVPVFYLDAGAPWASTVGALPGGLRFEAALAARVALRFDDAPAGLDHTEEWEAVYLPLGARFDPAAGISVDYDARDFRTVPPADARYVLPEAPITESGYYRTVASQLKEHLLRARSLRIAKNPRLGLFSRAGESDADFATRCVEAAQAWADAESSKLRDRHAQRIERVKDALATAERRVRELEADTSARRQQEVLAGAGKLLAVFLGGRAGGQTLSGFASRRSMTVRTQERLRTATEKASDKESEIEALEEELASELERIGAEAAERARGIEPVEVGLEKTDLSILELALVWIPRAPS
jgi:hypothetical protein